MPAALLRCRAVHSPRSHVAAWHGVAARGLQELEALQERFRSTKKKLRQHFEALAGHNRDVRAQLGAANDKLVRPCGVCVCGGGVRLGGRPAAGRPRAGTMPGAHTDSACGPGLAWRVRHGSCIVT